ncbi:MAG: nucleotide exchange factor GrpE [Planctomycetes bacterium]|nr:nucleotide exchange factor GrpE [Planctomycetota bacterium]
MTTEKQNQKGGSAEDIDTQKAEATPQDSAETETGESQENNDEPQNKNVTIRFTEYEELKTLAEERDEYLERLRRAVADKMNLQERIKKTRRSARRDALRELARKVVPFIDSLVRAREVARETEGAESISEGLAMTENEFYNILEDLGIKPMEVIGQPFDPSYHEAVYQQPTNEVEPNTIVEEIQKGFLLDGELLRPAQVAVSVAPPDEQ